MWQNPRKFWIVPPIFLSPSLYLNSDWKSLNLHNIITQLKSNLDLSLFNCVVFTYFVLLNLLFIGIFRSLVREREKKETERKRTRNVTTVRNNYVNHVMHVIKMFFKFRGRKDKKFVSNVSNELSKLLFRNACYNAMSTIVIEVKKNLILKLNFVFARCYASRLVSMFVVFNIFSANRDHATRLEILHSYVISHYPGPLKCTKLIFRIHPPRNIGVPAPRHPILLENSWFAIDKIPSALRRAVVQNSVIPASIMLGLRISVEWNDNTIMRWEKWVINFVRINTR